MSGFFHCHNMSCVKINYKMDDLWMTLLSSKKEYNGVELTIWPWVIDMPNLFVFTENQTIHFGVITNLHCDGATKALKNVFMFRCNCRCGENYSTNCLFGILDCNIHLPCFLLSATCLTFCESIVIIWHVYTSLKYSCLLIDEQCHIWTIYYWVTTWWDLHKFAYY